MISPQRKIIVRYISSLMFIAIIPLLLIGLISYQTSSRTLQEAESRFAQALLSNQQERLKLQLGQVENLIANISGVEAITRTLDDRDLQADTYTSLATQARIGYILNGYLHLQGLVSIDIFTEGGAHYHVGDTLNISEIREDTKDLIRAEALESKKQVYWAGVVPNVNKASNHQKVLAAARILSTTDRATMKQRPIALLLVNYSLDYLYQNFARNNLETDAGLALLDQRGNIIYSKNPDELGKRSSGLVAQVMAGEVIPETVTWDDKRYLIQNQPLEDFRWHLLSIVPEEVLLAGVRSIREMTALLLLIGFICVGLAAWLFTRNILNPIRSVISGYKQLEDDVYDTALRLPVRSNDEIGELVKWFNSFLDNLAARQTSEAALRESEQRYALVASATHEGLWDWNLITSEMYFSPRFMSLIGLNPATDKICDDPDEWFNRIHPDDQKVVKGEIDRHLAGNSPHFQCEHRLLHHDGSYHWILSHGLAERDENGMPLRMAGSLSDISARKEAENQLRHDAFHDGLTGLSNRAWFVSYLENKLNGAHRFKDSVFAVLFLDLDQFKIVNDTLGHAAGDELLIQVSERLQQCLRNSDLLARLGGDEFVILLEHSQDYHFVNVAERILNSFARPFRIKDQELYSGVSIGITLSSSGYKDPDEMLRDADIAMYQAKVAGKNRFVVFDGDMRDHLLKRITLEQDLAEALKHDGLELYYQPIISLSTGQLKGCEALLRWHHKKLGFIGPDEFIPIAESCNLIYPLGQWVLEAACRQWQTWKAEFGGMDKLHLSINISAMQFHDDNFIRTLPDTLSKYGVDGSELAFEITETALIRDTRLAAKVIGKFKKMGIRVHLDDFGTGFSSLSHLADFAIDLIKIDRSFVMQCVQGKKQNRVVRGLINMAKELGIQSTAEGIEYQDQCELLRNNQCEYGQGYYFSKPLPAAQMQELLVASFAEEVPEAEPEPAS